MNTRENRAGYAQGWQRGTSRATTALPTALPLPRWGKLARHSLADTPRAYPPPLFAYSVNSLLCVEPVCCAREVFFSVYVALTYVPEGELLTGFAMRSDPNVVFG